MKTTLALFVSAALTAASAQAVTGIVYDPTNHKAVLLNQASNYTQFVQQVTQLKLQLDQAKAMYNSLHGVRGMGALINNPLARQYLPKGATDLYNLGRQRSGANGLSSSIETIMRAAQIMKPSDMASPEGARLLTQQQTQLAAMQATAEAAYNAAGARFATLQTLVDSIDLARDPKAAADLANRINAENAMLQNEMIKLSMLAMVHNVQEKQLKQQVKEMMAKTGVGTPVYINNF